MQFIIHLKYPSVTMILVCLLDFHAYNSHAIKRVVALTYFLWGHHYDIPDTLISSCKALENMEKELA